MVCTSIDDEVAPSFIGSFRETFEYLGMSFGGFVHANCRDGYRAESHDSVGEGLRQADQKWGGVGRKGSIRSKVASCADSP